MGFSAGLYSTPIYPGGTVSYEQENLINWTVGYDNNSWAKEHFPDAKSYAYYSTDYKEEEVPYPAKEVIDFYKAHLVEENGYKSTSKSYNYWCSNGSNAIYDWFAALKKDNPEKYGLYVELTKDDILAFLEFCWKKLSDYLPKECSVNYAFKYIYDTEDEDKFEEPEIRLIPCDGIEVQFTETGLVKRIETSPEYGEIMLPDKYYDSWEMSGYIVGIEGCLKVLQTADFETQKVYYSGGW